MQGYDGYYFILALAKTVTPAGAGAGRTAVYPAVLFSQKILAVRSGNGIYRLVRYCSGFQVDLKQKRSHLGTVEHAP